MDKRKNMALIYTGVAVLVIIIAAVFVLTADKRYKISTGPVKAAEIDITKLNFTDDSQFIAETENIVEYFTDNGLNTAVIKVNSGAENILDVPGFDYLYQETELFKTENALSILKKSMNEAEIQVYAVIDCEGITTENMLDCAEYIRKNFALASIVLEHFTEGNEIFTTIYKTIKKGFTKTDIAVKTDDLSILAAMPEDIMP